MTRKDETAGKAIVNGPQGYRERGASRCEATEGQAGRDIRRGRGGAQGGAERRKGDGEPKKTKGEVR